MDRREETPLRVVWLRSTTRKTVGWSDEFWSEGRQVHAMDALVVRAEGDGIRPSVLLTSHARLGGQVRQQMQRIHRRRRRGDD